VAGRLRAGASPIARLGRRVDKAPTAIRRGKDAVHAIEAMRLEQAIAHTQGQVALLASRIRAAFSMAEPEVASSDATHIRCTSRRDGDEYVVNGRKGFTSGALNDNGAPLVVMGQTAPEHADLQRRQPMILVPRRTPGC
jgi:alkylation response protein AidB-like acyl-CoA dehydrogenase